MATNFWYIEAQISCLSPAIEADNPILLNTQFRLWQYLKKIT